MDSQRSLRKIQRVQRAGVTRAAGQRRPVGFTLLLVAIAVVGITLVFFARGSYRAAAVASPRVNLPGSAGDHYHNAIGIYLCDKFIEPLSDAGPDTSGIHSHDDGLIHIHPYLQSAAGNNAVMGKFFEMVGLEATGDEVVLPESSAEEQKTWTSGSDTCTVDEEDVSGQWVLLEYPAQAGPDTEPEVHTDGFADLPIRTDGQAWTLAFLPEDEVDTVATERKGELLPPSMDTLKNPGDVLEPDGSGIPGSEDQGIPAETEEVPTTAEGDATESSDTPTTDAATDDAATDEAPSTSADG
ncbi:MAG: hypothetical protein R2704_13615 [Microthrixaceae bacterium]